MLDQFYWAERMCWIGVAPEPLKRKHLVPDTVNDMDIKEAVEVLSDAIKFAVSPQVRARAVEIASRISVEVTFFLIYVSLSILLLKLFAAIFF